MPRARSVSRFEAARRPNRSQASSPAAQRRRTGRVPGMESVRKWAYARPAREFAAVDPAAGASFHLGSRRGSGKSARARRAGDLRPESPESSGYPGPDAGASREVAVPDRAGHVEGVLRRSFSSRSATFLGERFTNGLNYYLSTLVFNAFPFPQREAGAVKRFATRENWSVKDGAS